MTGNRRAFIVLQIVLALVFATAWSSRVGAQQPPNKIVSATVQPSTVTVGDSVAFQISIVLTGAGQPSVAIPVMDPDSGLQTPSPAGTQTSVESYIANGGFRSIQRITYNYSIRTTKEGVFTIPPATVTINGKTYETDPVQVEVRALPKAANVPSELEGLVVAPRVPGDAELQRKLTGVVFVLPVLSTSEPFNGEQVRLSYHLVIDPKGLNAAGIEPRTNLDGVTVPPLNEFIAEELYPFPQDLKFQEREIGGNLYLVAPVYEAVIASTKSGSLQIEPFQISMLFSMRSQGTRRRTPFDDDPFFSSLSPLMGGRSIQVVAQSPTLTLDVKPVPQQGRPADFNGAVGEFEVTAEVDRSNAKAYDDLVELDVTIAGKGNTDSLSAPSLPNMPGFNVLGQPEQQSTGRKDGDDYISVKKFSYTLRPTTPGKQEIPPIKLNYFDPERQEFKSASTDPIPLEIAPGSRPAPPAPAPSAAEVDDDDPDAAPAEPDLRYISTEQIQAPKRNGSLFSGLSGVVMFMVPPAIFAMAGLVAWNRNRSHRRQVDPSHVAGAASHSHLQAARRALDTGDTKLMSAELAAGIRLYFASRFEISEGEATIPEIEERLTRNGAPPELVRGISDVLEACDSAQFAPGADSITNARDLYDRAVGLMKSAEAYT